MHLPVSPRLVRGLFLCLSCLFTPELAARVWTPASDDALVLELAPRSAPIGEAARSWSRQQALTAAAAHLELLQRNGKPHHLEAIQILTQAWLTTPSRASLLLARAQQHQHQFDAALETLRQYPSDPAHQVEAALLEAAILRLQGRYSPALLACNRIPPNRKERPLCEWPVRSLSGELETAIARLTQLHPAELGTKLNHWRHSELAEMHERVGNDEVALRHWLSALQTDRSDAFVATATADLLIRSGQAEAALRVLEPLPSLDPVLIRRAEAIRHLSANDGARLAKQAWLRLQLAKKVHGQVHPRELAQTALMLGHHQQALDWARRNWSLQKEPLDARLLQLAAAATGDSKSTTQLQHWLDQTGLQDVRLRGPKAGDFR